ncbi:acetyl/propionyl/methylcrotonyl-CoA carboxylase subunit alpha [Kordiimonas sp. SCSIO 12610]|uniref:acetyl/propionyl/methylcrotonyl-CoA carboxylase subunit alpha n=1 Tax=Kordiimonas sp. SCSIO 12610 TaxID=2829597 RepID=UPI00210B6292|nr:acetyl/propionyl/methylcrotonyl-CoA carboxylase subunit alpha [Kordiimonas sp. SCSIO 12610]UTW56799.1 acetyl/propionyl/methylcrotonyl-CoA carboxylase subunit alpha [Kordiimonas sp. SCSIO 12610]
MNKPIRKVLIANRGEIACRVIRTCRNQGIKTVAVYSEVDANAQHVIQADEAVMIGAAAASESYLVHDKIIDAAKRTGADAIHPGYGFLSENPEFAERCEREGIIFTGPSAASMRAMALKGAAKKLMEDADVPVVPGYHGNDQSLETMTKEAERIGYPILIKAVAGGGGKGMRMVYAADELEAAIEAAKREGQNSFGNADILIEKLIQKPRHIELQVFGDSHGNAVHLFERDCSLQRRHQKVVEEAPAPGMSDEMRQAMGEAAVKAAKAINYVGAGTVEFIVDVANGLDNAPFYFMEMNTRLQVEHPVTELITHQDLVDWQIRIAEGHEIPFDQDDINSFVSGHAVEVRLYAEDPYNNFSPAIGTLSVFDPYALENEDQRIDTGVIAGDDVSIHYDPMIAKLIAYGDDRESAIDNLISLINTTPVTGLTTNRDFLISALDHDSFRAGDLYTGFIEDFSDTLLSKPAPSSNDYLLAALSTLASRSIMTDDPWSIQDSFRVNLPKTETLTFIDGEDIKTASIEAVGDAFKITVDEHTSNVSVLSFEDNLLTFELDGLRSSIFADVQNDQVTLVGRYTQTIKRFLAETAGSDDADGPGAITAPMPGKILEIKTSNGASVEKGDALIVMEAMKMEQTLKAPRAGIVEGLNMKANDQVSDGAILLTINDVTEE